MKDFAKSIVCNTKAEAEKVGNFEDPKKAKYYIEMWERRRDDAKRSLQNAEGHLKEAMKHRYGDKEFNQREVQRYQEEVKAAEASIKQYDDLIKSAAKTSFGNTRTGNTKVGNGIKEDMKRAHPNDSMVDGVKTSATYEAIVKQPWRVYDILGVNDSKIREYAFDLIERKYGINYATIYYAWLHNGYKLSDHRGPINEEYAKRDFEKLGITVYNTRTGNVAADITTDGNTWFVTTSDGKKKEFPSEREAEAYVKKIGNDTPWEYAHRKPKVINEEKTGAEEFFKKLSDDVKEREKKDDADIEKVGNGPDPAEAQRLVNLHNYQTLKAWAEENLKKLKPGDPEYERSKKLIAKYEEEIKKNSKVGNVDPILQGKKESDLKNVKYIVRSNKSAEKKFKSRAEAEKYADSLVEQGHFGVHTQKEFDLGAMRYAIDVNLRAPVAIDNKKTSNASLETSVEKGKLGLWNWYVHKDGTIVSGGTSSTEANAKEMARKALEKEKVGNAQIASDYYDIKQESNGKFYIYVNGGAKTYGPYNSKAEAEEKRQQIFSQKNRTGNFKTGTSQLKPGDKVMSFGRKGTVKEVIGENTDNIYGEPLIKVEFEDGTTKTIGEHYMRKVGNAKYVIQYERNLRAPMAWGDYNIVDEANPKKIIRTTSDREEAKRICEELNRNQSSKWTDVYKHFTKASTSELDKIKTKKDALDFLMAKGEHPNEPAVQEAARRFFGNKRTENAKLPWGLGTNIPTNRGKYTFPDPNEIERKIQEAIKRGESPAFIEGMKDTLKRAKEERNKVGNARYTTKEDVISHLDTDLYDICKKVPSGSPSFAYVSELQKKGWDMNTISKYSKEIGKIIDRYKVGNKNLDWNVGNIDWDVANFNGQWYITKNGQKLKGPFPSMKEAERYLDGHKWELQGKYGNAKTGNKKLKFTHKTDGKIEYVYDEETKDGFIYDDGKLVDTIKGAGQGWLNMIKQKAFSSGVLNKTGNSASDDKFAYVMREFDAGKLKTPDGKVVTNPAQAKAIAYSESKKTENGLARARKAMNKGITMWKGNDSAYIKEDGTVSYLENNSFETDKDKFESQESAIKELSKQGYVKK